MTLVPICICERRQSCVIVCELLDFKDEENGKEKKRKKE